MLLAAAGRWDEGHFAHTLHCGTDGWDTGGRHTAFLHTDEKAEAEKLKEVSENLCENQE